MKESLSVTSSQIHLDDVNNKDSSSDKLDMNGFNRVNVLFSGCTFVTIDSTIASTSSSSSSLSSSSSQGIDSIPIPPDHGAIAFVLRTGFGSSQGTLLQMIEFSQQTVSGDNNDDNDCCDDNDYYYYVDDYDYVVFDDDELITFFLSISYSLQVIRKKQA